MTFKELNLSAPLLRAVQEAGYETPSPPLTELNANDALK